MSCAALQIIESPARILMKHFGPSAVIVVAPRDDFDRDWTTVTLETSRSPEYLATLQDRDLAVVCGKESANLSAIRFPDMDALEEFRQRNPTLRTLVTLHPDGPRVWIHATGQVPRTQEIRDNSWQSDEYVQIHKHHEDVEECKILDSFPPCRAEFFGLYWTLLEVLKPARQIARLRFGPMCFELQDDRKANALFWACCYALCTRLRYAPEQEVFFRYGGNESAFAIEPEEKLLSGFCNWLMGPFASTGYDEVMLLIQPKGLRDMVGLLKIVAVGELPPSVDMLDAFLEEAVEDSPGDNVTTSELYEAFEPYCGSRDLTPIPGVIFERTIPQAMMERFGVYKSHGIHRGGTSRRGFNNVKLKAAYDKAPRTARTARTGGSTR